MEALIWALTIAFCASCGFITMIYTFLAQLRICSSAVLPMPREAGGRTRVSVLQAESSWPNARA
jgi:hypothetical protein